MNADEDDFFYEMQPSTSGLTLSQMNNKSSVLCPETQDITSQYLVLQQLDAHQKMISRAKGCVDTSPPKSMQSYRSVSSQRKNTLKHLKNVSQIPFQRVSAEDYNRPSSSRLTIYNSEEDDNGSTDATFVNKAIQTGIPVPNISCKTAEKISWYLEALSLGELHSEYFTFLDNNCSSSREHAARNDYNTRGKKKVIKGDILDWHREHFIDPKKPFSPRILADKTAKSKIRGMRCYNPPFRKKKASSSHSSDTFESYDEDDNEEETSQTNENLKTTDNSSVEEETLINRRLQEDNTSHYNSTIPLLPHYRRDYNNYTNSSVLNKNEEDKYLDFLSKVTEDILRSGVYSDKAIKQAFEFHMQFYKEDSNKEKLHSLLEQVLEGLKVSNDNVEENFQPQKPFLFSLSRPNTPPEKESSAALFTSDSSRTATELNSTLNESVDEVNELNHS